MKHIFAILFLIPLLLSCTSSPVGTESTPDKNNMTYVIESDSVTIAWDAPPDTGSSISGYELYARNVTQTQWDLLEENIAGTQTVIKQARLGTGTFELAVKSVSDKGEISDYHKSTDVDAIPIGGWILDWK